MSINKTKIFALIIYLISLSSFSQEINDCEGDKDRLTNLIKTNYKDLPVDGAK